jgi:hypothetical protein
MSSSSVVVLKRTEVDPAYEWYVDDEYLGPQSNAPGAHNRFHGIVRSSRALRAVLNQVRAGNVREPQNFLEPMENSYVDR